MCFHEIFCYNPTPKVILNYIFLYEYMACYTEWRKIHLIFHVWRISCCVEFFRATPYINSFTCAIAVECEALILIFYRSVGRHFSPFFRLIIHWQQNVSWQLMGFYKIKWTSCVLFSFIVSLHAFSHNTFLSNKCRQTDRHANRSNVELYVFCLMFDVCSSKQFIANVEN
jgi:hypothetical protein